MSDDNPSLSVLRCPHCAKPVAADTGAIRREARCDTARAIHSEIAELTFGSGVDVDGAVNVILSIIAGDFGLEDGDG